jgi:DNA topoisomerase-1
LSKAKTTVQYNLAEPKLIGQNDFGKDIYLNHGRFGPYLQYEKELVPTGVILKKKKKTKEEKNMRNVSIPKGVDVENIDLIQAKFLCSLPKVLGQDPQSGKDITLNSGRFGPYLKCENKSVRLYNVGEIFSIGINRAVILIAETKSRRITTSVIRNLGDHPIDKKPVRIMKGQFGPYIKYKALNVTIPEEKNPNEISMEEALILIEKKVKYGKSKKTQIKNKK